MHRSSSGGKSANTSTSIGSSSLKPIPRVSSNAHSLNPPTPTIPAPLSKLAQVDREHSPSSSASSASSSPFSLTSTVVASTPATSVSQGSTTSAVCKMKPLDKASMERTVPSELTQAKKLFGKSDTGKPAAMAVIPGSSPANSLPWRDQAASMPQAGSQNAPARSPPSPSSPHSSSLKNDPAARLVGGVATPAPAVVVSASVSFSCAGAGAVVSQNSGDNDGSGTHFCQLDVTGAFKCGATSVPSLLTQTAPRDKTHLTSSSTSSLLEHLHTPLPCPISTVRNSSPPSSIPGIASPPSPPPPSPSPPPFPPMSIKIADLGNATPSTRHYTEDIQTRQYRSPEAIVGRRDWDARVDVWSLACVVSQPVFTYILRRC